VPAPGRRAFAQDGATTLDSIQVSGSWLGTGLHDSVKSFAGARTVVDRQRIEASGAASIGDAMRRIPGVQVTDNSGTAGSSVSLNIGVRGLTGRYSPRSTVLLDGVPLAVAPYGQPQLSFAPTSLSNIESIDVVRGGGAVRYGPQNVGGIINFSTRAIPTGPACTAKPACATPPTTMAAVTAPSTTPSSAAPATTAWARPCCTPARTAAAGARAAMTASTTSR
jgi:Fe(3+) dicitrate transport protein